MTRALIAEKPSVSFESPAIVGTNQKNEGYTSCKSYIATWAFGHLLKLLIGYSAIYFLV